MVLDLVVDALSQATDRPSGRTRFQQVCVYLGLVGALLGAWITVADRTWVGPVLILLGGALVSYGR